MRNRFLLILALFCSVSAFADKVSRTVALQTARTFMQGKGKSIMQASAPAYSAPKSNASAQDDASYYVFNADGGKGYVIVSGDDRTIPVLGYSLDGTFDASNIPSNMKAWLQSYADEIAALKDVSATSSSDEAPEQTPVLKAASISPLIKSKWDQDKPYWNSCPEWEGQTCYTGCAATAMAQVMYYHKWPAATTTDIPAYTTLNHEIEMDAISAGTTIDWENMLADYSGSYTDEQAKAIANLMLYCGTSIEMDYGVAADGGSGASEMSVAIALRKYFDYDENLYRASRGDYSIAEWNSLLLSELNNNRPVLYVGYSNGGGHAFVIDGYESDDTGYFHVNWGWGGYCDGYFAISVLNPFNTTFTMDGFNTYQQALIGVQKQGAAESITPNKNPNSLTFENFNLIGNVLMFDFFNVTEQTSVFYTGFLLDDNSGNYQILRLREAEEFYPYKGYQDYRIDLSDFLKDQNFSEGTYNLYLYGEISEENLTVEGRQNYVEITVDADGNRTYTLHPIINLSLVEIPQPAELPTAGNSLWLKARIQNDGDEYNAWLYFFADPVSASTKTEALSFCTAIPAGEISEIEFYVTPTVQEDYNIIISTDSEGNNVVGTGILKMVTPTSIDAVDAETICGELKGVVYTIDGRRVQTSDLKTLARGLYIINGKKVVVK